MSPKKKRKYEKQMRVVKKNKSRFCFMFSIKLIIKQFTDLNEAQMSADMENKLYVCFYVELFIQT